MNLKKIKNNLLLIDKEGKYINNNENNNYIIAEFDIKEDNKNIRIINSYEQFCREYKLEYKNESENEKEMNENCVLIMN